MDVASVLGLQKQADIDLFVGVAHAGNDPESEHRGLLENWSEPTSGELRPSGETRRAALEAMIPGSKIADRSSLEGRWLIVRGDLTTYEIHLGSANVLTEDGHYLCIVRSREKATGVNCPSKETRNSPESSRKPSC